MKPRHCGVDQGRHRVPGIAIESDPRISGPKEKPMLDAIFLIVGLGFFALSIAYVFGCGRL